MCVIQLLKKTIPLYTLLIYTITTFSSLSRDYLLFTTYRKSILSPLSKADSVTKDMEDGSFAFPTVSLNSFWQIGHF